MTPARVRTGRRRRSRRWRLQTADCLKALPTLPADSVDAIVTDPPYGLEFMGKDWDRFDKAHYHGGCCKASPGTITDHMNRSDSHGPWGRRARPIMPNDASHRNEKCLRCGKWRVSSNRCRCDCPRWELRMREHAPPAMIAYQDWTERWAREALRVLKPGSHLLAFGGTRTFHRLSCALEDAGFEIRDCLMWLYGSGFPKSMNVARAVDKLDEQEESRLLPAEERFCAWMRMHSGLSSRRLRELLGSDRFLTGRLEVVNTATADAPRMARRAMVPTAAAWAKLRPYLAERPPAWVEALVKNPPQPAIEHPGQWRSGRGEGVNGDNVWAGWGTALKPAWEPIVVARKPLAGTVAQNVLAHRTGVLNIDGCRIDFASAADERETKAKNRHSDFGSAPRKNKIYGRDERAQHNYVAPGRWPTNVLLSHTPECRRTGHRHVRSNGHHPRARGAGGLGTSGHRGQQRLIERSRANELVERWECSADCPVQMLDAQSGVTRSTGGRTANISESSTIYGGGKGLGRPLDADDVRGNPGYGDEGGASRFFYCAKASRAERNAGLEGFNPKPILWSAGTQNPGSSQADGTEREVQNHHPTVKPIMLMRYLVRLITPPGGTVLDPFTGSGTTAIAAVLEGARFIGLERDPEYVVIARARIRHWAGRTHR